jgi:dipeptidase
MHASRWAAARRVIGGLVIGGLALTGCTTLETTASARTEKPSKVEAVAGTEAKKVVLTEQAVTRLGLQTATVAARTVRAAGGRTATRTTAPYSALLYDSKGDTWVFEVVGERAYLRKKVAVEIVDGETVVMTSGPAAGTTVVTVGAAVLYGAELGTGK